MSALPPQPPPIGYERPPEHTAAPKNGLGAAALVLGILAIVLAFIPILGFVSYPLSILGIIFGAIGVRRVARRRATNKGVAIAGLVLSVIGFILVIVSTVLYVGAINAGVTSVNNSLDAEHHVTYKVTTTSGSPVSVSYTQGRNGSASAVGVPSPWSVDTTVTGPVASLTASSTVDVQNPNRSEGLTCSVVDADTGKTLSTNTTPPTPNATVSCNTADLGAK